MFTISGASPNSTTMNTWGNNCGSIMPGGYFISNDGRFMYLETNSPIQDTGTSSGTVISGGDGGVGRLICCPVFDTSTTINGKAALRAFALGGWPINPNCHGFGATGAGTSSYYIGQLYSWCGGSGTGNRLQTAVTSASGSEHVYFQGYLQNNSWASTDDFASGTPAWQGGGPTNPKAWSDGSQFAGEIYAFNANVGGDITNLTGFGGTAQSTSRIITYMQPNNSGTKLAFQATASNTTNFANRMNNTELVYAVTNVNFSATGALSTVPARVTIEGTTGRASPSMSWDYSDSKLYYAFIASGSNENLMVLREATLNGTGTAVSGYRTQSTGFGGTAARFSILNSGR